MWNKKHAIASLAFAAAIGIWLAVLSVKPVSKPAASSAGEVWTKRTPDIPELDEALDNKDVKRAKDILKKLPSRKDWIWEGHLIRAAKLGDEELIRLVCKQGASPSLALFDITTPQEGDLLLKLGADINYWSNGEVDTPIGWFVSVNDPLMVKWCLQHGANPNCQTGRRTPLLSYAIWLRNTRKCTPSSFQEETDRNGDAIIALIRRHGGKE